ncbi:MAG: NAD(P)H-hydrate dehydratase [Victivallaceae bacterium]|nr:NAD(P)H-hydrate dehydratase [Victivallaceae bacterium]
MQTISVKNIRALESEVIARGDTEEILIGRAASGALAALRDFLAAPERHRHARHAIYLAGKGNNGADAVKLAQLAGSTFFESGVFFAANPAECSAKLIPCRPLEDFLTYPIPPDSIVIDGLLGIGVSEGPLREPLHSVIEKVNQSGMPVVSLDLPSGIHGDSGVGPESVTADLTVTFGRPKSGLFRADGRIKSGRIAVVDIQLGEKTFPGDGFEVVFAADAAKVLRRIDADTHKNRRGTVLAIGSCPRYRNALLLSARAALRSGAGKVIASFGATPSASMPAALIAGDWSIAENTASNATLLGPGMGLDQTAKTLFEKITSSSRTEALVIDADALTILSQNPRNFSGRNVLLTPHPGEAERLRRAVDLPPTPDRFQLACALSKAYGAAVILKGRQSVAAMPDGRFAVNSSGTAALATAGSGDVLAGLAASFLAQGIGLFEAAKLSMFFHGRAGELGPMRSLMADDLPERFPEVFAELTFFA